MPTTSFLASSLDDNLDCLLCCWLIKVVEFRATQQLGQRLKVGVSPELIRQMYKVKVSVADDWNT